MNLIIKKIICTNFKGIANKTVDFARKNNTISGRNGVGKTSISDAFYFVFGNSDTALHNNPNVCPLGKDEVSPCVEMVLDIDGKEITVVKIQKRTVKDRDGKKTVSTNNSYEVNSIAYGERDFKAKMAEYGFDFDLFLALSHPDVFVSKKSDEMRKILFKMASEVSDKDVAKATDGATTVATKIEQYSLEEIEAMQKSTLRKIREVYGKDGEIIDATINGLAMSKSEIETADLELQKNALKEQLAVLEGSVADKNKAYSDLNAEVMKLQFDLTEAKNENVKDINDRKHKITNQISDLDVEIFRAESSYNSLVSTVEQSKKTLERLEEKRTSLTERWKEIKSEKMDENTLICPTCHRELPEEQIKSITESFEENRNSRLKAVEESGFAARAEIEKLKEKIDHENVSIGEVTNKIEALRVEKEKLETEVRSIPSAETIPPSEKMIEIEKMISEKKAQLDSFVTDAYAKEKEAITAKRDELLKVEQRLAIAENNLEIEQRIEEMRNKKRDYEQQKANAEAILYQIELVKKKKNAMVQDSINSHFKLVKFKLFDYLKNGEYKEVCTPQTLDGKDIGIDTNTALEIRMKLDILDGLQNFFGQHYPIFLDNAECLDSSQKIELDTQLVMLKVNDGELEVR